MNVKSMEMQEKNTVEIIIEVAGDEWSGALDKAYRRNRDDIAVPGFRKGKAPRKVVEGMYGSGVFYEEAINEAYAGALEAAIAEKELKTVGGAALNIIEVGEHGFTFSAVLGLFPEITLGEYKGLSAVYEEPSVLEEDIDAEIEKLRERNSRLETVAGRPAKEGDTAVIDFEGFQDGVAFEGGKGENHPLELGSGSFIPGFEEQVVGMNAGEERDIDITFPEQYTEELAGKPAVFKVKVNEIKEKLLPEVDDEFTKDVSEFDTVAELREDFRTKLMEQRSESAKSSYEEALVQKAVDGITAEIPDAMVDEQIDRMMQDFSYQMQMQGMDINTYLQYTGGTIEQMRDSARVSADSGVRLELTLDKIAEAEGFEFSDEDCEAEYQRLSEQYGIDLDTVRSSVDRANLIRDMRMNKARSVIIDSGAKESAEKVEENTKKKPAVKKTAKKADEPGASDVVETTEEKPKARRTVKKSDEAAEKKSE